MQDIGGVTRIPDVMNGVCMLFVYVCCLYMCVVCVYLYMCVYRERW